MYEYIQDNNQFTFYIVYFTIHFRRFSMIRGFQGFIDLYICIQITKQYNHNILIMNKLKNIFGISLILTIFFFSNDIGAQRVGNKSSRGVQKERSYHKKERVTTNHRNHDRYRTQPVRRNVHYRYPRHRHVVRTLHRNHVRFVYGGLPYFYYAGIYYTTYGNEYIVVVPPRGFRIAVLPVGYVRIVVRRSKHLFLSFWSVLYRNKK